MATTHANIGPGDKRFLATLDRVGMACAEWQRYNREGYVNALIARGLVRVTIDGYAKLTASGQLAIARR